jgi:hypothetical protein
MPLAPAQKILNEHAGSQGSIEVSGSSNLKHKNGG